jgi:hypothetical protein
MEAKNMKNLKLEIAVDDKQNVIKMAIKKEGFEDSLSGDLEIAGLLEHAKRNFLPQVERRDFASYSNKEGKWEKD